VRKQSKSMTHFALMGCISALVDVENAWVGLGCFALAGRAPSSSVPHTRTPANVKWRHNPTTCQNCYWVAPKQPADRSSPEEGAQSDDGESVAGRTLRVACRRNRCLAF
jgi:hypothetical protein